MMIIWDSLSVEFVWSGSDDQYFLLQLAGSSEILCFSILRPLMSCQVETRRADCALCSCISLCLCCTSLPLVNILRKFCRNRCPSLPIVGLKFIFGISALDVSFGLL